MLTRLFDSRFAKWYLWASRAKYTMGLFFVAFVMIYLLFGLICDGPEAALPLPTAMQMVIACFLIGITQQIFLPENVLTKLRSVGWLGTGILIMILFSVGFGWFLMFDWWCHMAFVVVIILGMGAMIVSHYLQLNHETEQLNAKLAQFQSNGKIRGE